MMKVVRELDSKTKGQLRMDARKPVMDRVHTPWKDEAYVVHKTQLGEIL